MSSRTLDRQMHIPAPSDLCVPASEFDRLADSLRQDTTGKY